MKQLFRNLCRNSQGFTLIEILIVIAITGIIAAGLTTSIVQVFKITPAYFNRITAYRYLDTAGQWFIKDFKSAYLIPTSVTLSPGSSNTLSITQSVNSPSDTVVSYSINSSKKLIRTVGSTSSQLAPNITNVTYTIGLPSTVQITMLSGSTTEIRTFQLSSGITFILPFAITNTSMPGGDVTVLYHNNLVAFGGTLPYTWSKVSGSLPNGLSLDGSSGVISGTPTAIGTFNFTMGVTDAVGNNVTAGFSIIINAAPSIITNSLPYGTEGVAYSQTLGTSGGWTPYRWSETGSWPDGLVLDDTDGTITGIPTTAGTYNFTIQALDAVGGVTTKSLSIIINHALTIVTGSLPDGTIGVTYNQTLVASGGVMPYTWSLISGSLPTGLNPLSSAGVISGTPSATGTFNFTIQVTDSTSPTPQTVTKQLSIVVGIAPLSITTTSLPPGTINTAYSQTLVASGGVMPYTWSLISGSLPTGLNPLSSAGVISGTPSATGTFNFTIRVTDSTNPTPQTVTKQLSIKINTPLAVTTNGANPVGKTTATLNGTLTSLGSATNVNLYFEWGTTTSYGTTVAASPPSVTSPQTFTANLTGLTHKTTYYFRAKAVVNGTTVYGGNQAFTTTP